ncbi:hypothetical protein DPX39_040007700 [Trypanosoma brucei equiperdum]|uniref:DNA polymerase delta subunit 3 n=1 Tax=Trypanosoma brucei equiperdum TaxID=630700 RepID=A0A3L6L8M1_9TRYP|nr:hypothetical protein DPX39_040007700 [Trypanosoma brucei equiperdum]
MSPLDLLQQVESSYFVHASEVPLPKADVRAAFENIATSKEGYEVLFTVTGRGTEPHSTVVYLCSGAAAAEWTRETLDEASVEVYALRKRGPASAFQPRKTRPALVPRNGVVQRERKLVPVLVNDDFPPPVKKERSPEPKPSVKEAPSPPPPTEEPMKRLEEENVVKNVGEEEKNRMDEMERGKNPAPVSLSGAAAEGAPKLIPKESGGKKQQTLLGMPVGGAKRDRLIEDSKKASPKAKKPRAQSKKEAKVGEATTSLMKLAKASKKSSLTGSSSAAAAANGCNTDNAKLSRDILDDEEQSDGSSRGNRSPHRDEGLLDDPEPVLEVAFTPAENDEIILCDNAPPMIFCAPEPTSSPLKRDPHRTQAANGNAALSAHPKLTGFFQPEVIAFQKEYSRELETDTVFEGGEYICSDRVVYRHVKTGAVLSEEEYHKKSAELMRTCVATEQKSTHDAGSKNPLAAGGGGKASAKVAVERRGPPKVERQGATPQKNLMSFFGAVALKPSADTNR